MTLQDYVGVLRRGWRRVLLVTVLGTLAAVALTVATPSRYSAQATVYVSVNGERTATDLASGNAFATQRVTTYADLAVTTTVLHWAAEALGGSTGVGQLRESMTAGARKDKSLIDIIATDSDPVVAAKEANAVASALTVEAPLLDAPGLDSPVRLTLVQSAETPGRPVEPKPRHNLLIGVVVGLVLGVTIVVVTDSFSTRIRSIADLPRAAGLATLTSMPSGPKKRSQRVSATDARLESFRQLRANLQFGSHVGKTLAVTGVTAASGAQAVARQLAAAFAEIGSVVVVVDLDLRPSGTRTGLACSSTLGIGAAPRRGGVGRFRRAHLDELLAAGMFLAARCHRRGSQPDPASQRAGVADVLSGTIDISDAVIPANGHEVHEVPAGHVDSSSAQRMSTPAMREMLEKLEARFDHVLLACPPLVERSESAVAAALAGSALVVLESGATKRSEFLFALELLAGVRVTSISVAIDHVRDQDLGTGRMSRLSAPEEPGRAVLS